ncbi:hypothetical protein CPAR01_16220 [Colletotrichum paranaense]|uniref:Uncharacterized protein n=1 Tax=Colletotrichum paranaense TaxID=1914294 RepID=A0ABQ9RYA2_9PEZI|nr:uncharacterized protein CPAR01_16220 [Colletotrichum paranaense]KAK1517356.1 hypothetical protein CPAR01_16220 [Colletotrichum paranaense]
MSGTSGFALRSLSSKRMARLYRGINHGAHLLQLRCIYGIPWRHGKLIRPEKGWRSRSVLIRWRGSSNATIIRQRATSMTIRSILRPNLLRRMMRLNLSVTRAYSGLPTCVKVKVPRCIPKLSWPFIRTMSSLPVYGYCPYKSSLGFL